MKHRIINSDRSMHRVAGPDQGRGLVKDPSAEVSSSTPAGHTHTLTHNGDWWTEVRHPLGCAGASTACETTHNERDHTHTHTLYTVRTGAPTGSRLPYGPATVLPRGARLPPGCCCHSHRGPRRRRQMARIPPHPRAPQKGRWGLVFPAPGATFWVPPCWPPLRSTRRESLRPHGRGPARPGPPGNVAPQARGSTGPRAPAPAAPAAGGGRPRLGGPPPAPSGRVALLP